MKRTHLYESLHTINQGIDTVIYGLHDLKGNPELLGSSYNEVLLDMQHRRVLLNLQFMSEMQQREQAELYRVEQEIQNAALRSSPEQSA